MLLTETVAQNNLALRQQLSLVVRWKQQSEAQLQEQRQQAAQAVQQLSSLQQENATLKAHLASVKVSVYYIDERICQGFQKLSCHLYYIYCTMVIFHARMYISLNGIIGCFT